MGECELKALVIEFRDYVMQISLSAFKFVPKSFMFVNFYKT